MPIGMAYFIIILASFDTAEIRRLVSLIVVITATAAWVPWWGFAGTGAGWLSHMGGVSTNQIVIGVIDKATRSPIHNAEVVLTSIAYKKKTTQQGKTSVAGAANFSCRCYDVTNEVSIKNMDKLQDIRLVSRGEGVWISFHYQHLIKH